MIFKFRNPNSFRRLFKRKKDVTLVVLEPVKLEDGEKTDNNRQNAELLKQKVYNIMENANK